MRLKFFLITIVISLFTIDVIYWQSQQAERLYTDFLQRSAPPTHSQRARFSESSPILIKQAVQAMSTQSYTKAQAYAATLLQSDPHDPQAQLIFGYTLLYNGDFERAKPHLFAASESLQEPFNADAAWFLALIYLREHKKEICLHFLQLNIKIGSVYSGLAQELLTTIGV